jgi:hypothetical protein
MKRGPTMPCRFAMVERPTLADGQRSVCGQARRRSTYSRWMTVCVLILLVAATSNAQVPAELRDLPDANDWPKVTEIRGRYVEAIDSALTEFRREKFSTSGNLKHFNVELKRHGDIVTVAFFPEYHEQSRKGPPGRNKYGTYVTYFVSLRTLKVLAHHFERD